MRASMYMKDGSYSVYDYCYVDGMFDMSMTHGGCISDVGSDMA